MEGSWGVPRTCIVENACEIYAWPKISKSLQSVSQFELAGGKVSDSNDESCGLAVEHSAHDRKVVGSIPVQSNARWKWC